MTDSTQKTELKINIVSDFFPTPLVLTLHFLLDFRSPCQQVDLGILPLE